MGALTFEIGLIRSLHHTIDCLIFNSSAFIVLSTLHQFDPWPVQCNSCPVYNQRLVILIISSGEDTFRLEQIRRFKCYTIQYKSI